MDAMRAASSSLPTTVHGTTTRCELALAHSTTATAIIRLMQAHDSSSPRKAIGAVVPSRTKRSVGIHDGELGAPVDLPVTPQRESGFPYAEISRDRRSEKFFLEYP